MATHNQICLPYNNDIDDIDYYVDWLFLSYDPIFKTNFENWIENLGTLKNFSIKNLILLKKYNELLCLAYKDFLNGVMTAITYDPNSKNKFAIAYSEDIDYSKYHNDSDNDNYNEIDDYYYSHLEEYSDY